MARLWYLASLLSVLFTSSATAASVPRGLSVRTTAGQVADEPWMKLVVKHDGDLAPQLRGGFADPGLQQAEDGRWYSFATNGDREHVQMAVTDDLLSGWTRSDHDVLPDISWTTGNNLWAPDVRRMNNGSFVMYFSGEYPGTQGKHCIGVATSSTAAGPYTPQPEPWVCALDQGGAIDASGFWDPQTGRRYVLYKVDGSKIGHGGDCNNGVEPIVPTPIMIQEVSPEDGFTKIGAATQILDREDSDGPLVEAPNLVYLVEEKTYVLFFSSHCVSDRDQYNVKYAMSKNVMGPYVRANEALLTTGDFGLVGPGGATSHFLGGVLAFHGWCADTYRCLYTAPYDTQRC